VCHAGGGVLINAGNGAYMRDMYDFPGGGILIRDQNGKRHIERCINPKERGGRELPPKVVQHLLGHSSIIMTLDVYGHLFRDGGDRAELEHFHNWRR
jgi:hypothetical protein